MNWIAGWILILTGFAVGAVIGLFFHRDGFLGGYNSFPRRMLRLGHIALVALGMLNLIVAVAGQTSAWLVAGGVLMPAVCFLTAWRRGCRHLFFLPVVCLVVAGVTQLVFPTQQGIANFRSGVIPGFVHSAQNDNQRKGD